MLYSGADRWLYILSEMNDILAESAVSSLLGGFQLVSARKP